MANLKYSPYQPCVGRKYRLIPKLYRPFVLLIGSNLCNDFLLKKNKIKFINQWLRWFYKSRWGYKHKVDVSIKNNYNIVNGSIINLCARTQKAAFKNLLLKLNYQLCDYDVLKKRQYVLYFTVLFFDVNNELNNDVSLDILSFHEDLFKLFIVLNGYYIEDFKNILYYYDNILNNVYYDSAKLEDISCNCFNVFHNSLNLDELELELNDD